MTATEIITTYPGKEGTEARVAKITDGYSASLWDTDAGKAVGVTVYRSDRFEDALDRADAAARSFVEERT